MKKWIEDLLELQTVDIRLRNLAKRIKMLPKELADLKEELSGEQKKVQDTKERIQKIALSIKKIESDIQVAREMECKLGAQTNQVKKNEEYQALLKEIDHQKEKISDLETDELMLLDDQEEAQQLLKGLEKELVQREKSLKEQMQEIVDIANDLKQEIEAMKNKKPALESKVGAPLLSLYKRLLGTGKGMPLSSLVDGNCGNCHLKVIPEIQGKAINGEEVTCSNCGFLLYDQE